MLSPRKSAFLLVLTFLLGSQQVVVIHAQTSREQQQAIQYLSSLWQKAMSLPPGSLDRRDTLSRILQLQPQHVQTRMQLGLETMDTPEGVQLLEDCYNKSIVGETSTLEYVDRDHAWRIANFIGRYHQNSKHYAKAQKFFEIAMNLSKQHNIAVGGRNTAQSTSGDVCTGLQLATHLDAYPLSVEGADQALATMNAHARDFLSRQKNQRLNDQFTSDSLPNAAQDPYDHCLLTNFYLSFYYRANVANVSHQHYQLTAAAWPDLVQVAPHVQEFERKHKEQKPCASKKKIKLGIVSGTLSHAHPVTEDFSGVLSRLDRNLFEVTYLYLDENGTPPADFIFKKHANGQSDRYVHLAKSEEKDFRNSTWVRRYAPPIMKLELDMILYLDMTMSTQSRRLGMQRLAPVQLNTHGHPITSGHPRSTVQYFVSWAEAELARKVAVTLYGRIVVDSQWNHSPVLHSQSSTRKQVSFGW